MLTVITFLSIISKSLKVAAAFTGYRTPHSDPLTTPLRKLNMIHLFKSTVKVQVRAAKFVALVSQSQKLMYGLAAYSTLVIVLLSVG